MRVLKGIRRCPVLPTLPCGPALLATPYCPLLLTPMDLPSFPVMPCWQQHTWTLRLSTARVAHASPLTMENIFLGRKCHLQLRPWDSLHISQQPLTWKHYGVDPSGTEFSEQECIGLGTEAGWEGECDPSLYYTSHKKVVFFLFLQPRARGIEDDIDQRKYTSTREDIQSLFKQEAKIASWAFLPPQSLNHWAERSFS